MLYAMGQRNCIYAVGVINNFDIANSSEKQQMELNNC